MYFRSKFNHYFGDLLCEISKFHTVIGTSVGHIPVHLQRHAVCYMNAIMVRDETTVSALTASCRIPGGSVIATDMKKKTNFYCSVSFRR